MNKDRHRLTQIIAQGRQLSEQCDHVTSSNIDDITRRIEQQWSHVEQCLQERVRSSRDLVEHWRQFNGSYVQLLDRLGELETRWYAIQRDKFVIEVDILVDRTHVSHNRTNTNRQRTVLGL
jgi:hypothetical protein